MTDNLNKIHNVDYLSHMYVNKLEVYVCLNLFLKEL